MQVKVWAGFWKRREGRDKKGGGREELEMGGGQSFVGSGLEAGVALPRHARWSHTPPGSAPTAPDMLSAPCLVLLCFPINHRSKPPLASEDGLRAPGNSHQA